MNFNDLELERIDKTKVNMSFYEGKVLLIVNTASKCGFTPQYEELEKLYRKYQKEGFEILAFPCNQFRNQEPEPEAVIESFCKTTYDVTFPLFAKINVTGENIHPLYQWLTENKGFQGFDPSHPLSDKLDEILSQEDPEYKNKNDIKWNFTKFLIDRNGVVKQRFEPTADIDQVEKAIQDIL